MNVKIEQSKYINAHMFDVLQSVQVMKSIDSVAEYLKSLRIPNYLRVLYDQRCISIVKARYHGPNNTVAFIYPEAS